jgi:endonuclease-3
MKKRSRDFTFLEKEESLGRKKVFAVGGRAGTRAAKELLRRASRIDALFGENYPDAVISLNFGNPLELLVATILSAQCTDVRVNKITPTIFSKYRTAAEYAAADPDTFGSEIRAAGFFRNKSRNIIAAAREIAARHGGEVPAAIDDLVALPGIGRKTANVILGNAFGTPGMVVDTHVGRLSRRLGLTKNIDAVKVEFDLMRLFPRSRWTLLSHQFIAHGRRLCRAQRPRCGECFFDVSLCPARGRYFPLARTALT